MQASSYSYITHPWIYCTLNNSQWNGRQSEGPGNDKWITTIKKKIKRVEMDEFN